jgi:hypothetical protein
MNPLSVLAGSGAQARDASAIGDAFRSKRARRRKFETYEKQSPASARDCKHDTLYEVVPEAWHLFGE